MEDKIIEIVRDIIPVLGALGGAYLGVYFTRKTQLDLFNREQMIEQIKEKRDRTEKTMRVYSEIARSNGEEVIVSRVGGDITDFNFEIYINKIRPIIFDGFIYIHSDVAEIVDDIDSRLAECGFNEEALVDDHLYLCSKYFDLTALINSKLDAYRKQMY